jgi:hypothetical protein
LPQRVRYASARCVMAVMMTVTCSFSIRYNTRYSPLRAEYCGAICRASARGTVGIRINQQWRICFSWTDAGPDDVEIVDYR